MATFATPSNDLVNEYHGNGASLRVSWASSSSTGSMWLITAINIVPDARDNMILKRSKSWIDDTAIGLMLARLIITLAQADDKVA